MSNWETLKKQMAESKKKRESSKTFKPRDNRKRSRVDRETARILSNRKMKMLKHFGETAKDNASRSAKHATKGERPVGFKGKLTLPIPRVYGELTPIVAMDCEMVGVGTRDRSALARVSIINFEK